MYDFKLMFASRHDAGQRLGRFLRDQEARFDIVLGLPRGGVVVAAEVARVLRLPLDTLIVRKIGHPWHREFAVGAMAEHGVVLLDEPVIARSPGIRADLADVIKEESMRLRAYESRFHPSGQPALGGKAVLLVDDGLATGATTEAAVLSVQKQNPTRVEIAAPVASESAIERLLRVADDVRVLLADPDFEAVGGYYDHFSQTSDDEVIDLLKAEAGHHV
jgi:predicted phosphoribosyltransferase